MPPEMQMEEPTTDTTLARASFVRPDWVTEEMVKNTSALMNGSESDATSLIVAFSQLLSVAFRSESDEELFGGGAGQQP